MFNSYLIYTLTAVSIACALAFVYFFLFSIVHMKSIMHEAKDMLFVRSTNFYVESSKILLLYSLYFSLITLLSGFIANITSTGSLGLILGLTALIEVFVVLLISLILSLSVLARFMSTRFLPNLEVIFFSGLFLLSVSAKSSNLFVYVFEFGFLWLFFKEFVFVNRQNQIRDNTYLTIEAEGESMEPFLQGGDTLVVLTPTKGVFLNEGDIVIYSRLNINTLERMLISHRLINITGNHCTLKGDNSTNVEKISVLAMRGILALAFRDGEIIYENRRTQIDQRILSWKYANTLNMWPPAIRSWNRFEPMGYIKVLLFAVVFTALFFLL